MYNLRCADCDRCRPRRVRAERALQVDARTARTFGRRSRHGQRRLGRLSADLRRGRARGGIRRRRPGHCARRLGSGRADRRQQGDRHPRRALQRSLHRAAVARAQRRQRPRHGRAHRRLRAGRRDSDALARHRVRGRPPSAPPRSNVGAGEIARLTMATQTTPSTWRSLAETDPDIAAAIRDERHRQNSGLELIASENFVSRAVLEAAGSVLTNKYAEGYPGKRYYGGCEFVDVVERAAIARAKALFGADHANVQPHSGAQANMSVCLSVLKPGDVVLGMNLAHGGHLTHGHPLNFSGKLYTIVPYGVRKADERIDYDELDRLADEHRPKMIMVGASAYPRVIEFERIRPAADRIGATVMTDMAHIAGLVAAGLHPSPVPHSDFVTTTTHKTLRGPRAGLVLCREQYA